MKIILIIFGILFSSISFGQTNYDTLKFIAKINSFHPGDETHSVGFQVIKVIQGKCTAELIRLNFYAESHEIYRKLSLDTVLVTLIKDKADTTRSYNFPEGDPDKGVEEIQISTVNFDYWEGCETGKGECKPLRFERNSNKLKWFLLMPCGGTATTVTLTVSGQNNPIQKTSIEHSECPPIFDLTNLADGKYFAYMLACGLGGQIEINLTTTK
ncbi:MAG: hypothetical protein MUC87_19275 [Bacteroidia bacterium]|jgi:hypothetical protein|nr:hypothetical protein [Bacteroidia bacterium]